MQQNKPYTPEELQVCLRLAGDTAVMAWLESQVTEYKNVFPSIPTEALPRLQMQCIAISDLILRIQNSVKYAENMRNDLRNKAITTF